MQNGGNKKYDLEERTALFGERIIEVANKAPKSIITSPIISQLIRAGVSVGANYCEADCAESRKDFEHKLGICKKEAKEVKHLLRMLVKATPSLTDDIKPLLQEADELQRIFIVIVRNSKINSSQFLH